MSRVSGVSRRGVLTSLLVGPTWWLGVAPAGAQAPPAAAASAPALPPGFSPWLKVAADGRVTALTNVSDIGQGTWSTLRVVVAEELDLPLEHVTMAQAPLNEAFVVPWTRNYATFGSLGYRGGRAVLAPAAAAARDMLLRAAAELFQLPVNELRSERGQVHHGASGRSWPYAALIARAAQLVPPEKPTLKPRADWKLLGQPQARADLAARTDGSAVYGLDVRLPGLLHAVVRHAPTFGGRLGTLDDAPARQVAGVEAVVRLPGAVAVVARGTWAAMKGLGALQPQWLPGPNDTLDSEALRTELLAAAAAGRGKDFSAQDDPAISPERTTAALAAATQLVDLSFDVPFLAHATMEPLNATARVQADRAELWLSTQSQLDTQRAVAQVLGLQPAQVTVHSQLAGGGFGRRLEHDWAVQAALIARAVPGRPVQMLWTRDVDMRSGHYRPASAARVRIALGPDGMPTALRADVAQPSLLEHSGLSNGPKPDNDWTATMGWLRQAYAIPALQVGCTRVDRGVPCGYWRSVGASQNTFFYESAIDEAARRAGRDPLDYRLQLLAKDPRARDFVQALAKAADWGRPLPAGQHRGLAIGMANGAISGHVVEVAVPGPGRMRLLRITAAVDAGIVGDPRAVEAQMMGGTVFGLSAALFGEITLKGGQVQQASFADYPLLQMAQLPPLQVLVLGTGNRAAGVGEEGPPTIGPAMANALAAATGRPVTRLPLSRAGWTLES